MATVNFSSPWVQYYRKIEALFRYDKEIRVVYDDENVILNLYVSNGEKASLLTTFLPNEMLYGGTVLSIEIWPVNCELTSVSGKLSDIFKNNSSVQFIETVEGILDITYVVFKDEIVHYYSDDLGDYYRMTSTLYENLAREIFRDSKGVYFSTYYRPQLCNRSWP